jgi:hypothetical protein
MINSKRWLYINFSAQIAIKEDIFYIHLKKRPKVRSNNNQKSIDKREASNRNKCLFIIHTVRLSKIFGYKSSLVPVNNTIGTSFNFVDPLTPNNKLSWRQAKLTIS